MANARMPEVPRWKRWRRLVQWTLLSLFVLYALSIGPALRARGPAVLRSPFFWPMVQLARLPGPGELEAMYLNLWSTGQHVERYSEESELGERGVLYIVPRNL